MQMFRGELFYFTNISSDDMQWIHIEDGVLCVEDGKIADAGDFGLLKVKYADTPVKDYRGYLLLPGFIDAHIHSVQSEMIGLSSPQLLDWLSDYTFPLEMTFKEERHCREIADIFLKELFRNGTTSCAVFGSVHPQSVDALFGMADKYRMCLIGGKVQMSRNAPESLCENFDEGIDRVRGLIEKWHGKGRLRYAITPRFAISCSADELHKCGRLHEEYPDTYIQTHLSENKTEVETVRELFRGTGDYLQVYEDAGLLTHNSLFAHAIHLSDSEWRRISDKRASVVHCPTSNAFLGSGIYDMRKADGHGVQTILGTDVGAGTSFSMLQTMGLSYMLQQLGGYTMPALEVLYKSTLGAAKALHLEHEIGCFLPGRYADFVVVGYDSSVPQQLRRSYLERLGQWNMEQKLFGLQTMADDRAIKATYIAGNCVHEL